VLETINEIAGPLRVRHHEPQRGDAKDTAADISRARSELDFAPRHHLQEGLRAQLDWQRAARGLVVVE
jgi:nucleoside-diphosphate-sugar epimerase